MSSVYPKFPSSLHNLVQEVALTNLFKSPPQAKLQAHIFSNANLLENYILVFHMFVEENDNLTKELKLWA